MDTAAGEGNENVGRGDVVDLLVVMLVEVGTIVVAMLSVVLVETGNVVDAMGGGVGPNVGGQVFLNKCPFTTKSLPGMAPPNVPIRGSVNETPSVPQMNIIDENDPLPAFT